MMEATNMRLWFKSKKTKTPKVAEKPKNEPCCTEPTAEPQKPVAVEKKPQKKGGK